MPAPVRIVVLDDTRLLFNDLRSGAGTSHRRAQEHVDDEHEQEHQAKRNAQVQQP